MKITLATISLLTASMANAAVLYTQSFNGLPTTATTVAGTAVSGTQGSIASLSATGSTWYATRVSGTGTSDVGIGIGNGSGNTGGLYSFATTATPADRSFGLFASNTTVPAAGLALVNNFGSTMGSVTIAFTSEQWRSPNGTGAVVNTVGFAYGFSSNNSITAANFLTSNAMTADASGNLVSGQPTASAVSGSPTEVTSKLVTLTGLNWAVGETLFIRWQDPNEAGADAALAIDDLTISGTAVPAPGAAALIGLAGLITSRRRK